MDIKEIEEVLQFAERNGLAASIQSDHLRQLITEHKKYKEALHRINFRASSYTNREVPAIVLNEVREISGLALNEFLKDDSNK